MNASGYTFYNMYTVEGNTITEGYSCQTFGISGIETCIQGGDASYYGTDNETGNWGLLTDLNANSTFKGAPNNGKCDMREIGDMTGFSDCYAGDLRIGAQFSGGVFAVDDETNATCYVDVNGVAYCVEW